MVKIFGCYVYYNYQTKFAEILQTESCSWSFKNIFDLSINPSLFLPFRNSKKKQFAMRTAKIMKHFLSTTPFFSSKLVKTLQKIIKRFEGLNWRTRGLRVGAITPTTFHFWSPSAFISIFFWCLSKNTTKLPNFHIGSIWIKTSNLIH